MPLILAGLGLLVLGAIAALLAARAPRLATLLGVGGTIAGCACALVPVARVLLGQAPESLRLAWSVPFGAFALGLDGLSAFFLLPILTLAALAALYGGEYLGAFRGRAVPARAWPFFALLVASMALVRAGAQRRAVPGGVGGHVAGVLLPGGARGRDARRCARRAGRTSSPRTWARRSCS